MVYEVSKNFAKQLLVLCFSFSLTLAGGVDVLAKAELHLMRLALFSILPSENALRKLSIVSVHLSGDTSFPKSGSGDRATSG